MVDSSVTVMVLVAPETGVLWPIALVANKGSTTASGSVPLGTPYRPDPVLVISAMAIVPTFSAIWADTLTAGDAWSEAGLVKTNVTSTAPSLTLGPPDAAVITSLPGVCVKLAVLPSFPDVVVTASDDVSPVIDPVRPVIVIVDPSVRS